MLKKILKMTDIREGKFLQGFQLTRDRQQQKIWMSQETYVGEISKRFNLEECMYAFH